MTSQYILLRMQFLVKRQEVCLCEECSTMPWASSCSCIDKCCSQFFGNKISIRVFSCLTGEVKKSPLCKEPLSVSLHMKELWDFSFATPELRVWLEVLWVLYQFHRAGITPFMIIIKFSLLVSFIKLRFYSTLLWLDCTTTHHKRLLNPCWTSTAALTTLPKQQPQTHPAPGKMARSKSKPNSCTSDASSLKISSLVFWKSTWRLSTQPTHRLLCSISMTNISCLSKLSRAQL